MSNEADLSLAGVQDASAEVLAEEDIPSKLLLSLYLVLALEATVENSEEAFVVIYEVAAEAASEGVSEVIEVGSVAIAADMAGIEVGMAEEVELAIRAAAADLVAVHLLMHLVVLEVEAALVVVHTTIEEMATVVEVGMEVAVIEEVTEADLEVVENATMTATDTEVVDETKTMARGNDSTMAINTTIQDRNDDISQTTSGIHHNFTNHRQASFDYCITYLITLTLTHGMLVGMSPFSMYQSCSTFSTR